MGKVKMQSLSTLKMKSTDENSMKTKQKLCLGHQSRRIDTADNKVFS